MDVSFDVVGPRSTHATVSMTRYFDELRRRFPEGFDPGDTLVADAHHLEDLVRALGHRTVRLDTNQHLPEAIALYRRAGYHEIDRYNDNPHPTHFFEKSLD
jgi:GNAT superfamily N-acetyltransferase